MDVMLLAHLKSSYEDWRVVFDGDTDARKAFVSGDTLVSKLNDSTAIIVFYGVDMEGMGGFLATPEFAARTEPFVGSHTVYSITEIAPPG